MSLMTHCRATVSGLFALVLLLWMWPVFALNTSMAFQGGLVDMGQEADGPEALPDTTPMPDAAQAETEARIVVDQAGYLPDTPKFALVLNGSTQPLTLREAANDQSVLELALDRQFALANGMKVRWFDFSQVQRAGDYYLQQGAIRSARFRIGEDVYDGPSLLMQRSYFLQRCGVALRDKVSGFEHQACHTDDGVLAHTDAVNQEGEPLAATGGWHDAGDFGKYIAPATVTVSRLLSLFLMQPERYQDNTLHIPESGNGKPDLLDEVGFELAWMLKMQRMDGAVYRKLSGKQWVSERLPEQDTGTRYVFGVSSAETAKFAASMAIAARAYRQVQPFEADTYLQAAEHAWQWLEKNPDMKVDWYQVDDSGSGAYMGSDTDVEVSLEFDDDDRLSAAIELYLATGGATYRDYVLENALYTPYTLYEWKNPSALSLWHLLTDDQSEGMAALRGGIRIRLMERADRLMADLDECPFGLANQRFVWGSNKMTAEEGITLLHAWKYSGDERYLRGALWQVDYLFGRNPFNLSYVSGVGQQAVRYPVHLFGRAVKRTLPGLLVGGPNSLAQDRIAPFDQAMFSYVDNERAYSVNEYAIDYNSTLIGLLEILAIYRQELSKQPAK